MKIKYIGISISISIYLSIHIYNSNGSILSLPEKCVNVRNNSLTYPCHPVDSKHYNYGCKKSTAFLNIMMYNLRTWSGREIQNTQSLTWQTDNCPTKVFPFFSSNKKKTHRKMLRISYRSGEVYNFYIL